MKVAQKGLCRNRMWGGTKYGSKKGNSFILVCSILNMPRGSAYHNEKKHGLNPSVPARNAKNSKTSPKNTWVAGGHAPQGKPSKALAKKVKEYLRRTGQLK